MAFWLKAIPGFWPIRVTGSWISGDFRFGGINHEEKWICNILETIPLNLVAAHINIMGNINLHFYDLNKRKVIKILFGLEVAFVDTLEMISKNLLIIGEIEYLTLINVETYENIKNIKIGNILISVC